MTDKIDSQLKEYIGAVRNEEIPKVSMDRVKGFWKSGPKASCPHCGKDITPFKKPLSTQRALLILWFFLAVASFAISFVMKQYFYQWLVLTLLFGVKGIVDQRAAKTQILIYKAIQEDAVEFQRHK